MPFCNVGGDMASTRQAHYHILVWVEASRTQGLGGEDGETAANVKFLAFSEGRFDVSVCDGPRFEGAGARQLRTLTANLIGLPNFCPHKNERPQRTPLHTLPSLSPGLSHTSFLVVSLPVASTRCE